jgi:autotransporter translocation and assembly factor TamB
VKKLVAVLAFAVAASLAVTALAFGARASSISVNAKLNAMQEVPAQVVKDTKAKGKFTGTLVGSKLTWKLTFSGLTGPATAAHIHLGAMGKAGNVAIPLCAPCKTGVHGKTTLSAALKKALKHHKLYVNVHTAKNPNGETRGQLAEM